MWWIGSFARGDDGGGGGEPSHFMRASFWWLLGFGAVFYLMCSTIAVHDLMAYRTIVLGASSADFWIGEQFGRAAAPCLFFGLVLFLPAITVWLLGRFFDEQRGDVL
jgi:hypothetical protein